MSTYTATANYSTVNRCWKINLQNGEQINLYDVDPTTQRFVVLADVAGGYWWGTQLRYADQASAELAAGKLLEIPSTKVAVVELDHETVRTNRLDAAAARQHASVVAWSRK